MRILLDSKDLIDVIEHDLPIPYKDFAEYLQRRGHQLVLSFTSIREFSAPLFRNANLLYFRSLLQRIESLPICYIREGGIQSWEIQSAKKSFDRAIEYHPVNPYVERWDETAFVGPSPMKGIVNLRLDDIVLAIWREQPKHLIFPTALAEGLRIRFREQRNLKLPIRKSLKQLFIDDVIGNLTDYSNAGAEINAKSFADWVYSYPHRCPGFRLHFEAYHEFLANKRDVPDDNDIADCAHIYAIPYVDAITFDRRWRAYCTGISNKLRKLVPSLNYADKLYPNLKAILQAYP